LSERPEAQQRSSGTARPSAPRWNRSVVAPLPEAAGFGIPFACAIIYAHMLYRINCPKKTIKARPQLTR
jgi:hypothetical protein